jgi:hypothetical protein
MTMTVTEERPMYEDGDRVKIDGENGFYWVRGYSTDGSLKLWGGDQNPNGYRQNRAVMPDKVKPDERPLAKKAYPEFVNDL